MSKSLDGIFKSLGNTHDAREYLLKHGRDIIILCSRSIVNVHRGDIEAAKQDIEEARKLALVHRQKARGLLAAYLRDPEQELVEAMALVAIAEKRQVPSQKACGVSEDAYILGLLDCIGELKRMVFDCMRTGDIAKAERVFEIMEEMYRMLYPFATFDRVLRDARKKLDVNRALMESTRAALTEETRRARLLDAIRSIGAGDGI